MWYINNEKQESYKMILVSVYHKLPFKGGDVSQLLHLTFFWWVLFSGSCLSIYQDWVTLPMYIWKTNAMDLKPAFTCSFICETRISVKWQLVFHKMIDWLIIRPLDNQLCGKTWSLSSEISTFTTKSNS